MAHFYLPSHKQPAVALVSSLWSWRTNSRSVFHNVFTIFTSCVGWMRLLPLLLLLAHPMLAQDWNQIIKTAASDRRTLTSAGRTAGDYLGYSVAIDGDYAVVGVPGEDEDASGSNTLFTAGSAIVFKRVNGTWTQIKKLVASDRAANDAFGFSVAISGSQIVVGAYQEDEDASGGNTLNNSGSAYVFSQNQGGADNWGQVRKLVASDRAANDAFGYSVSISGSLVVVGAYQEDEDASGGNTLNNSGSAYVFSQNQGGADNWGQLKKLVASDRAASDAFGFSVGISGSLVVVGAFQEDEDASGGNTLSAAGSAYVFSQNQGGPDNWGQLKKLVPSDRAANNTFSYSLGISGSLIVVGSTDASAGQLISAGSAYVFSQNQGGPDNWGQVKKLVASDRAANDQFGISVGISGSQIVVGAYRESEDASGGNTLSAAGSAYVFSQNQGGADNWGQVKKLVASDRATGDFFGISVAISGSQIVAGAYQEDEDASGGNTLTDAGSAYVFSQNQGGTDNWGQTQKLVLSDYVGKQNYGFSVAIDGNYAVVGAYLDYLDATSGQPLLGAGSAYVLKQQNGSWTQIQKLVASDRAANDYFGLSVAINGNQIVVGAPLESEDASGGNTLSAAGSAYVFSQNQGGSDNWGQIKKLVASDRSAGDTFGWSVGVSGSHIVVGAYQESEDASGGNTLSVAGSAYIFNQNQGGTNNWGQIKKIVASDRAANDAFGYSVSINGSQLVVGAYQESEDASGGNTLSFAGSAYVFNQNQGGADNWGQVKKLVASDRATGDVFGYSVGISGSQIVVGAPQESEDVSGNNTLTNAGSAYVFSQNQGGTNNWGQVKKLVASDRAANDRFGFSVSNSGSHIVVGAFQEDEDASGNNMLADAGSAYVFNQNQGGADNWGQVKKLMASDRATNDLFGWSVSVSGNQLVVGAPQESEDASGNNMLINTGSAYFFRSTAITLTGFATTSSTACAGSATTFTATVGNVTGAYNFTLTNGSSTTIGTTSSMPFSQSWTAAGSGTQTFTLTVADNGASANANTPFTVNAMSPDYQPLVDLYTATNGVNWTDNTGWLQGCNPCTGNGGNPWFGITCANGRVTEINLFRNKLIGTIPNSLSALTSLQYLYLNDNQLAGSIPLSLSALTNLQYLYLFNNQLTGSIPTSLSALSNLQDLYLYNNQLTGSIPNSLSALTNLKKLFLDSNQLTGNIPDGLSALSNLQILYLNGNQLTGSIPNSLSALNSLQTLRLNSNLLTGSIPVSLSVLTNLQYLYLFNNQLTGSIPTSLSALNTLKDLDLSSNQLTGSIPVSLSALNSLQTLFLNNNQLTGCIPAGFSVFCGKPIRLSGNPGLPGGGNFSAFCSNGTGSSANALSHIDDFPASQSACVGSSVHIPVTVSGSADSYQWYKDGALLSGQTSATLNLVSLQLSDAGSYAVAASGCNSLTSNTFNLIANALPTPMLTGNLTLCAGQSTTLAASGGVEYAFTGPAIVSQNATAGTAVVNASGTYSVTVTNSAGCSATATTTISNHPLLSIAAGASLSMANLGVVISLTASSGELARATTYQWNAPPTALLTTPATGSAVSASLTTAGVQTFTVVATSSGCSQSALISVTALTGPDLSPILSISNANFAADDSKVLLVQVQEVNGATASGAILITITVPVGYSVSFDNTLTSFSVSGGESTSVDNTKWHQSSSVSGQQISLALNNGQSVGANSTLNIGILVTRTTANSGSASNITVNIADDSSGRYDVNRLNNVYARIINGL
ncbi:MAG: leucine-rich repeat domain-containing protein [Spirosoma sp.]|nr:leucine-rich repeat domain-containing protein [Spirosoma sp.]OJW80641.1 MAG: hypothetical protein BGO59_34815 [Spirosoma sp. 48-14]